jgi:hypothetical protein
MVCSLTHPDMPDGMIDGEPEANYGEFRVRRWKLNKDFSIDIQGVTTVDEMYDLTVGPKPADVQAAAMPAENPIVGAGGDTGNPSGASSLAILTHTDDYKIPPGHISLSMTCETTNKDSIYALAIIGSLTAIAEGPYAAERAAHPECTLETSSCVLWPGRTIIRCTRAANPAVIGEILILFTNDTDIDGNLIIAEGTNYYIVDKPFNKSGIFTTKVIRRFFDIGSDTGNSFYKEFSAADMGGNNLATWRTPYFPLPAGLYYLTVITRNKFGLGTRLTKGPVMITYDNQATTDTGNPGPSQSITIISNIEDDRVPKGMMAFRIVPPTVNNNSIFVAAVVLTVTIPGHGPYAAQRAAYPIDILHSGSGVTITPGQKVIPLTIAGSPALEGKVFQIHTAGTDKKLDGHYIKTHASNYIALDMAFYMGGVFDWEITEETWNNNSWYNAFYIPNDFISCDIGAPYWQTIPVKKQRGTKIALVWCRNFFGLESDQ